MGGSTPVTVNLGTTDPNWSIAGIGDFNKDGASDILWRKNDRTQLGYWKMGGSTVVGVDLGTTDPNWSIVGTGDFNKDGATDILWRKNDRTQLGYWDISSGKISGVDLGVTDPNWTIVGTGDFNKDGATDILWQKNDRTQLGYWKMGGSTVVGVDLGVTDPNLSVISNTNRTYLFYDSIVKEYNLYGSAGGFLGAALGDSWVNNGSIIQKFVGGVIAYLPTATAKASRTFVFSNDTWNKYQALGGVNGTLKEPSADITDIGGGNYLQNFATGRIITTKTGTYYVTGYIGGEYSGVGNVTGFLGVPLGDGYEANGSTIQKFVGGVIALLPTATAKASKTFVFSNASWQLYGNSINLLGLPTLNITELSTKEGWIQSFEKGSLYIDRNGHSEIYNLHDPAARQLAKQVQNGNNNDLDTAKRVAEALRKAGYNVRVIADALANTFTLSGSQQGYVLMTYGLSISGLGLDTRQIADLLFDGGATVGNIAQSFNYYGYGLDKLADALKNGVTKFKGIGLTYDEIALGIRSSGYEVDARALSDLLRKQGASLQDISNALQDAYQQPRRQVNTLGEFADLLADLKLGGQQILSVLKTINTDLIEVTRALQSITITKDGNNNSPLNYVEIANMLFQFEFHQSQDAINQVASLLRDAVTKDYNAVAKALKYGVGIGDDAVKLARVIKQTFGWQGVNGDILIAGTLWNNGIGLHQIADALQKIGSSSTSNAEALFQTLLPSKPADIRQDVARALNDGAQGYTDWDVARGIWNTFNKSRNRGMTPTQFAKVLLNEGFGKWEVVDMVGQITGDWLSGLTTVGKAAINNVWNQITNTISEVSTSFGKEILSVAYKIPIIGTVVGGIETAIDVLKGNDQGALASSINAGLATVGLSTVITPKIVDLIVGVGWALSKKDWNGAIASALKTFGVEKTTSDVVVSVIDKVSHGDTSGIFKDTLTATGFDKLLGSDPQKTVDFFNLVDYVKDGKFADAANILVKWNPSMQTSKDAWIQKLKNGDLQALQDGLRNGLSAIGLQQDQSKKLTEAIVDYKNKDYTNALAIALSLSKIQSVQAVAQVTLDLGKQVPNYTDVFKDALGLVEGGQSLAEAFEYLAHFDVKNFINSMVSAAPILLKLIV